MCQTVSFMTKEILIIVVIFSVFAPLYFVNHIAFATLPSSPNNLSAYPTPYKEINMSWNPSASASSYVIYRNSSASIGFVPIVLKVTGTNYVDTDANLIEGVKYTYKITAINSSGESGPSTTVSVAPYTPITTRNIAVAFIASTAMVMGLIFIV